MKISIWGELFDGFDENIKCNYFENEKCKDFALWKHQNNKFYCDNHHYFINNLNKERQKEFINEYKENIIFYLNVYERDLKFMNIKDNAKIKGMMLALKEIKNKINKDDFDLNIDND